MKNYEIEYRDCIGMRCGVEMKALHEKEAIINLQQELIEDGDYMTELIHVDEVEDKPEWKLNDGTPLDQDSQDTLNDAMGSYTNSSGLTLEEAIKRVSERKNNK
jgi:hypothetical protein